MSARVGRSSTASTTARDQKATSPPAPAALLCSSVLEISASRRASACRRTASPCWIVSRAAATMSRASRAMGAASATAALPVTPEQTDNSVSAVSISPSTRCVYFCGSASRRVRPSASASSAAARLPLSTVET
jgi:hypothetical protein